MTDKVGIYVGVSDQAARTLSDVVERILSSPASTKAKVAAFKALKVLNVGPTSIDGCSISFTDEQTRTTGNSSDNG